MPVVPDSKTLYRQLQAWIRIDVCERETVFRQFPPAVFGAARDLTDGQCQEGQHNESAQNVPSVPEGLFDKDRCHLVGQMVSRGL